jgi:hypothetical protein
MIGVTGIALLPTRFARAGRRLLVASVILIAAMGVLPVAALPPITRKLRFRQIQMPEFPSVIFVS